MSSNPASAVCDSAIPNNRKDEKGSRSALPPSPTVGAGDWIDQMEADITSIIADVTLGACSVDHGMYRLSLLGMDEACAADELERALRRAAA